MKSEAFSLVVVGIRNNDNYQCTQLKEITEYKDALIPTFPLGCWHANFLILDRHKCVLFTNDLTRYSFLVPGLRKADFQMLDEVFRQNLFKCMLNEGISQEGIEKVLDEIEEIVFTSYGNRSILGTMNDLTNMIRWRLHDNGGLAGVDISELNMKLNRVPSKALGNKYSIDLLRDALE
ncbi:MAG: hypothetical protein WDA20_09355 [Desulfuromonadales bacterium]